MTSMSVVMDSERQEQEYLRWGTGHPIAERLAVIGSEVCERRDSGMTGTRDWLPSDRQVIHGFQVLCHVSCGCGFWGKR